MPKLFPIHLQVEELFVGKILRQLNAMQGVAKVDLAIDQPAPKTNGAGVPLHNSQKFAQKAEDFILDVLVKEPMATKDLRTRFENAGRKAGSTSSSLNNLFRDKLIKKEADGKTWSLTKKAKDRLRWRNRDK